MINKEVGVGEMLLLWNVLVVGVKWW